MKSKTLGTLMHVLVVCLLAVGLLGCPSEEPDTLGEKIEETADEAGDAAGEAAEEVEEAAEEAKEAVDGN